jgi:hypothetical protein
MAQDVDQLRRMILALQEQAVPEGAELHVPGVPPARAQEYRQLLLDLGLADVYDDSHLAEKAPHKVFGLTAVGQIFSEHIRDEPAWNEAKESLAQAGQPLTLEALMMQPLLRPEGGAPETT